MENEKNDEPSEREQFFVMSNNVFHTAIMLIDLDKQNHRGASETYARIGEALLGVEHYHEFYKKYIDRDKSDLTTVTVPSRRVT